MQRTFYSLVLSSAALIACCYGFARFAYGLFVPVFTEEFRLSPTTVGIIGGGSYVGYCAAIVTALLLTDRIGARRMAVIAGLVATAGLAAVATAQSATQLAVGILVAGMSTGLASPPLAAAIAQRLAGGAGDRAQTVVNAGTGIGVLLSGPIAFLLTDQWRIAWAVYAVIAAGVTGWVALALRDGGHDGRRGVAPGSRSRSGAAGLLSAAVLAGVGSIAIWNFGRDLIGAHGGGDGIATAAWILLGAAGVGGAFGGDAVQRLGLRRSWVAVVVAMSAATVLLVVGVGHLAAVMVAAGIFGAAYIGLTGLLLLWSTRVYPESVSFGVGLSFFALAAGQAVGAPLVGALVESSGYTIAFVMAATLGAASVMLSPASTRPALMEARPPVS